MMKLPVCSAPRCGRSCGLRDQLAAHNVEGKWLCQIHYDKHLARLQAIQDDLITINETGFIYDPE